MTSGITNSTVEMNALEDVDMAINKCLIQVILDTTMLCLFRIKELKQKNQRAVLMHGITLEAQREKWQEAINKEFLNMEKCKVWKKTKPKDIPAGWRCVKHKWVWNIKRNGIFCACLVACGYSQVAVTYRILLIVKILLKLKGVIVDVDAAFCMETWKVKKFTWMHLRV
jgi:hypothetical protein